MNPFVALLATASLGASSAPSTPDLVAVRAGTIHTVEDGRVIEGGGTILINDGVIVGVGEALEVPSGARVVDYGPDAVVVPGLVAANSSHASAPGERTAEPGLLAIDEFDPYSDYYDALRGGVTSLYLAPAPARLLGGQGAVVKASGKDRARRILSASAAIQGSISADARNTPSYWEPPVPATVDVGIGEPLSQLPRSTMGAIVALGELLDLAEDGTGEDLYGDEVAPVLRELLAERRLWRMRAETAGEIRALLDFFGERDLPLVIDGGAEAGAVADELARAGVATIVSPPGFRGEDFGKSPDAPWPRFDTVARLARAGAAFAISTGPGSSPGDLRLAAGLAMRGGLGAEEALEAITLAPATLLGVADRVGSLAPGKDADLLVFSGPPLAQTSSVVAAWIDGDVAWTTHDSETVVLEVAELHVGDGEVLSPGQILLERGRIAEVGRRVAHPPGATVVRGFAAMPGMIDAMGFLGLEGSTHKFNTKFELSRIVEPGDYADRQVALAGVTTVVLTSRSEPGPGSPTMAYKPAGEDFDRMVIADPNALRVEWSEKIRGDSGDSVKKLLEKAKKYKTQWEEYEKAIAEWTPPEPKEATAAEDEDEEEEDENAEEQKGDEDEEKAKDEKKKKKKKDEEEPARPVTGIWQGDVTVPPSTAPARLRLRLNDREGVLEGSLRCDQLSDGLVDVSGSREEKKVSLEGLGSRGWIALELALSEGKLVGSVRVGEDSVEIALEQSSTEYEVAGRPDRVPAEPEEDVKGKPKRPGLDAGLEPVRRAMDGTAAILVEVTRADELDECLDTFAEYGIRPVVTGLESAWEVTDLLEGRVAGVLLSQEIVVADAKKRTLEHNRYRVLSNAGIPVAFHSGAEEAAVELPLLATYAVSRGMSPAAALVALTAGAAEMLALDHRVGKLAQGLDADVLLLDGPPLEAATSVLRVWVDGKEIR